MAATCHRQLLAVLEQLDGLVGAAIAEHAPDGSAAPGDAEIVRRIGAALAGART
jgi:hypothetical protein